MSAFFEQPGEIDATNSLRDAIEKDGYAIAPHMVPVYLVETLRRHWLDVFSAPKQPEPLIWGPYLGEPNKVVFDRAPTHCLYRSYDYLWNAPLHGPTRALALQLSRFRNGIVEEHPNNGELMTESRYGSYVTTSYYPANEGWLHSHRDDVPGTRHWHFIVPLTFKGPDFQDGGLYLIDRHGTRIDVDAHMAPGSVLFFDANLEHGVDAIVPLPGSTIGRLQMFAIPTLLELPHENTRLAESISLKKVVRAKLGRIKRRIFGQGNKGYHE